MSSGCMDWLVLWDFLGSWLLVMNLWVLIWDVSGIWVGVWWIVNVGCLVVLVVLLGLGWMDWCWCWVCWFFCWWMFVVLCCWVFGFWKGLLCFFGIGDWIVKGNVVGVVEYVCG